jgi:GntR family transcriptional regulator
MTVSKAGRLYIDKASPVQLWYQLRSALLSSIMGGQYGPGDPLPTEQELCDSLGVSRSTVRTAVLSLVRDGLIVRVRGKGSFVATPSAVDIKHSPMGFHRAMTSRGYRVSSRILEVSVVPAPEEMALELQIANGEDILYIRRLRYVNERPAALSKNYLVYNLCRGIEDADLCRQSLWQTLELMVGGRVIGGIHSFCALLATDEERELLELPPNSPLLVTSGINYLDDGTPFECSEVKLPGKNGSPMVRYVTRFPGTDRGVYVDGPRKDHAAHEDQGSDLGL